MLILFLVLIPACEALSSDSDLKINLGEIQNIIREQNERIGKLEEGWKELQMENSKLKVIIDRQQSEILEMKSFRFKVDNTKTKSDDRSKATKIHPEKENDYHRGQLEAFPNVDIPGLPSDGSLLDNKDFEIRSGPKETFKLPNTSRGNKFTDSDVKVQRVIQKEVNFYRERRLLQAPTISSATVAFYAYMSKTETAVGPHHTLVFDNVETNIGNAYNKHTGAFTTPTDGVYMFSYSVFPTTGSHFSIELTINSVGKGSVFIQKSTIPDVYGSTGNAIFLLNQGDVCLIRTLPSYSGAIGDIRSDIYMRSTFSGFKIST